MIDRCFDSRMQLNVQLISEGPSRNSTAAAAAQPRAGRRRLHMAALDSQPAFVPLYWPY